MLAEVADRRGRISHPVITPKTRNAARCTPKRLAEVVLLVTRLLLGSEEHRAVRANGPTEVVTLVTRLLLGSEEPRAVHANGQT